MKDKTFCETKGQLDIIPSNVPVVFISYSWDSDEHKAWVKQLSDDLRQKFGIYTILYQYNSGGTNLTDFMERGIEQADRVLLIGTPRYKQKLDKSKLGCGVQYEEMIINSELYVDTTTRKIIPILRSGAPSESFKKYICTRLWYDFRKDDQYNPMINMLAKDIWGKIKPIKLAKFPQLYEFNDIRCIIGSYISACMANSPAPNCFWSVFYQNDSMTPITSEIVPTGGVDYFEKEFAYKQEYRIKLFYEGKPFVECAEGSVGICCVTLYGAKCGPFLLSISHENGTGNIDAPRHLLSDLGFSIKEAQQYVGCDYELWHKDNYYAILECSLGSSGYRYSFYISGTLEYLTLYKENIIDKQGLL